MPPQKHLFPTNKISQTMNESRPRKFCAPNTALDFNLRVRREKAAELLADPRFTGVPIEELLLLANSKMRGVTDRCTAIAVLRGAE
jgi:hypothetical protein